PGVVNIGFVGFYPDDLGFAANGTTSLGYDIQVAIRIKIIHTVVVDIGYRSRILYFDGLFIFISGNIDYRNIHVWIKIIPKAFLSAISFGVSNIGIQFPVFYSQKLLADRAV